MSGDWTEFSLAPCTTTASVKRNASLRNPGEPGSLDGSVVAWKLPVSTCSCVRRRPRATIRDAVVAGAGKRPSSHLPLITVLDDLMAGPGRCSPLVMEGSLTSAETVGAPNPLHTRPAPDGAASCNERNALRALFRLRNWTHSIEIRTKSLETTHLAHVAFGAMLGRGWFVVPRSPTLPRFVSWIGSIVPAPRKPVHGRRPDGRLRLRLQARFSLE